MNREHHGFFLATCMLLEIPQILEIMPKSTTSKLQVKCENMGPKKFAPIHGYGTPLFESINL